MLAAVWPGSRSTRLQELMRGTRLPGGETAPVLNHFAELLDGVRACWLVSAPGDVTVLMCPL